MSSDWRPASPPSGSGYQAWTHEARLALVVTANCPEPPMLWHSKATRVSAPRGLGSAKPRCAVWSSISSPESSTVFAASSTVAPGAPALANSSSFPLTRSVGPVELSARSTSVPAPSMCTLPMSGSIQISRSSSFQRQPRPASSVEASWANRADARRRSDMPQSLGRRLGRLLNGRRVLGAAAHGGGRSGPAHRPTVRRRREPDGRAQRARQVALVGEAAARGDLGERRVARAQRRQRLLDAPAPPVLARAAAVEAPEGPRERRGMDARLVRELGEREALLLAQPLDRPRQPARRRALGPALVAREEGEQLQRQPLERELAGLVALVELEREPPRERAHRRRGCIARRPLSAQPRSGTLDPGGRERHVEAARALGTEEIVVRLARAVQDDGAGLDLLLAALRALPERAGERQAEVRALVEVGRDPLARRVGRAAEAQRSRGAPFLGAAVVGPGGESGGAHGSEDTRAGGLRGKAGAYELLHGRLRVLRHPAPEWLSPAASSACPRSARPRSSTRSRARKPSATTTSRPRSSPTWPRWTCRTSASR